MSTSKILEVRDLNKIYRVRRRGSLRSQPMQAVRGVSFDLAEGAVLGVVGASGCGKTTLSKMLLGLEKPTSGDVLLDGRPLAELGRMDVAGLVQPVFQDPYSSLNPRKNIAAIISLPLRLQKPAGIDVGKRVQEMMELTGLPPRLAGAYPSQLSGGQRQRVAIARALIARPRLVICDEPTSALDVSIQSQILNMLQDLRSELGLTLIVVSHNLAVIEHLADDVIVMSKGEIVERGAVDAIFAAPQHPYTRMLLDSVLTPDPSLGLPAVAV